MSETRKAVVMLVHGSRDPAWMAPFQELAHHVRRGSEDIMVAVACLQICSPSLDEAVAELVGKGAGKVRVVPVFISAKGHVLKDVPGAVGRARKRFPGLDIEVAGAIGEEPEVKDAMQRALIRVALS